MISELQGARERATRVRREAERTGGPPEEPSDEPVRDRSEMRRGAVSVLPLLLGYAPFAAVVGSAVAAHGNPLAAWAGTATIYGGAAQLAVLGSLDGGSGPLLAVVAGLVVNVRLILYSASFAGHWRDERLGARMAAAALLTDPSWAVGVRRYEEPGTADQRRLFYLGAALALWTGWLAMVTAAALAGGGLGLGSFAPLRLAGPLCLLVLAAPMLRTRGGLAAAGAATLAALAAQAGAGGAALLAAVAGGVCAGLAGDGRGRR